eukprot:3547245-Pyramimonas_sp.AAC.1
MGRRSHEGVQRVSWPGRAEGSSEDHRHDDRAAAPVVDRRVQGHGRLRQRGRAAAGQGRRGEEQGPAADRGPRRGGHRVGGFQIQGGGLRERSQNQAE